MNIRDTCLKDEIGWDEVDQIKVAPPVIKQNKSSFRIVDIMKDEPLDIQAPKPVQAIIKAPKPVQAVIKAPITQKEDSEDDLLQQYRAQIEQKLRVEAEIKFEKVKERVATFNEKIERRKKNQIKYDKIRRDIRREIREQLKKDERKKLVDLFGEDLVKQLEEQSKKRREYYKQNRDHILEIRRKSILNKKV